MHSRANTDHLHVPRKDVGRGPMQEESAYIAEITKLMEYVESKIPIKLLEHTNIAQTQNYFKQMTSRNLFKVK
jgi:hypothetical protein